MIAKNTLDHQIAVAFYPKHCIWLYYGRSPDSPVSRSPSHPNLKDNGLERIPCVTQGRITVAGTVSDFHGIPF